MSERRQAYDVDTLLRRKGIAVETNSRGWSELDCPFCKLPHLGWSQTRQVFFCWYCKKHPIRETVAKLLNVSLPEVGRLLKEAEIAPGLNDPRLIHAREEHVPNALKLTYPRYAAPITERGKNYLRRRGLDWRQVQDEFSTLMETPPYAQPAIMALRLVAPLIKDGREVSWQGRSMRDDCDKAFRYMTCPKELEVVFHKSVVYGMDQAQPFGKAVVVEGLFDVWKLGPGAVHTFGTSWSQAQLASLSTLKQVFVMFDSEAGAQRAGRELAAALAGLGVRVSLIDPEDAKDPGEWPLDKARSVMRELGFSNTL